MSTACVHSRRVLLRCVKTGLYEAKPAAIYINGGRISRVVETSFPPADTECPVDDLGDALVTPAFVNAHTHNPMNAFRGVADASVLKGNVVEDLFFKLEMAFEPGDVRAFTRMGAYENLLAGVGTVWDHYYGGVELAEAFRDVGICAAVAPTLQDVSGPGKDTLEDEWNATLSISEGDFGLHGVVPVLGPHATDTVSDALWKRILETSEKYSLPIHCHNAQSLQEYQRSFDRHGCTPVERLRNLGVLHSDTSVLLVHNLFATAADLAIVGAAAKEKGNICMVFCPLAQMQFAFPAHVGSWIDASVPFVLGTDAAASNDAMALQLELRGLGNLFSHGTTFSTEFASFRETGSLEHAEATQTRREIDFSQYESARTYSAILDTVLERPGALHPQLPCGAIREGYLANLVAWDVQHPNMWPCTNEAQVCYALCGCVDKL
eukprot:INCI1849.2.p1 GENE.INCI1849.2~~INCI1849.2.p1  ORF type:complete len:436 (-),score=62.74 INCI1849.2:41-1348(-)